MNFASSGPEVDILPSHLFNIGPASITNTMLYTWIFSAVLIVFLIWVARRVTVQPQGGLIQFVEALAEFIHNMLEGAFIKKDKAKKYTPFFLTLFIFILVSNLLGLMPFTGSAFEFEGMPLLKPFTADMSATLAAAFATMMFIYYSSIKEAGSFRKYIKHFFFGSAKNPLYLFIGIIEIMSDLFRMVSLSLRLFLNVAIGELIVAIFQWLGSYAGPIVGVPFWMFDAFDVILQAYIFVILSVMYLAIAVNHGDESEEEFVEEALEKDHEPELVQMKANVAQS